MVTTTLAAVALSGLLTPGAVAAQPSWQADYAKAMSTAVAQQKPMAVFIGRGQEGHGRLVTDGQIPERASELLNEKFVCVYVNTETPEGKTLADQFGVTTGVVLSSKGGSVQALRHAGPVAPAALTDYLTRYGTAQTVTTTEKVGLTSRSGYTPLATGVTTPFTGAPTTAPTAYPGYYPGYSTGGGCPGGNCGSSGGGFIRGRR